MMTQKKIYLQVWREMGTNIGVGAGRAVRVVALPIIQLRNL